MGVPLVKIERDKAQLHRTSKPTHTCACRKGLDIEELQPSYQSRQVQGPIFFFRRGMMNTWEEGINSNPLQ